MQQVTISIEESRYALLLQFLSTLDYVHVEQAPAVQKKGSTKPTKAAKHGKFLEGMKTTTAAVSHTMLNREEIYGDRV
jgi:hypothetical protein